jgi:hypothetical protein
MITNGAVDRAVHGWIADDCSRSTVKNSIAVLVRVMEQAVRDRGARTWPGKSRSRPSTDCGSPRPSMTSSFTRRASPAGLGGRAPLTHDWRRPGFAVRAGGSSATERSAMPLHQEHPDEYLLIGAWLGMTAQLRRR